MPRWARGASDAVRRATAAFAAAYSGAGWAPKPSPADEPMFTIAPLPRSAILGTANWIARMTEPRFSSIVRSQCSIGASGKTGES